MKGTILLGIAFLGSIALQVLSISERPVLTSPIGMYSHIAELVQLAEMDSGAYAVDSPLVKSASESVVMIQKRKDIPVREIQVEIRNNGLYVTIGGSTTTENMTVATGSGFFVTEDGYLLTNKHVVSDEAAEYVVQDGNRELKARVVYRDPNHDIAVLKVSGNDFPTLSLSGSTTLKVGDLVTALGNAWGEYIDSAATGTVSSLDKDIQVAEDMQQQNGRWVISGVKVPNLIETNLRLYPGDSGGPILDQQGNVIGVSVASAITRAVGYAIPVQVAKEALIKAGVKI